MNSSENTKFVPSEGSGIFTRVCTLDDLFQVVVGKHLQMEKNNEIQVVYVVGVLDH
jgi:hypothetical protein